MQDFAAALVVALIWKLIERLVATVDLGVMFDRLVERYV